MPNETRLRSKQKTQGGPLKLTHDPSGALFGPPREIRTRPRIAGCPLPLDFRWRPEKIRNRAQPAGGDSSVLSLKPSAHRSGSACRSGN